jgi:hypothetical protein
MSESLNDVAFDLELEDTLPQANELELLDQLPEISVPVRSITNSHGCAPKASSNSKPSPAALSNPTPESETRPIRRPRRGGRVDPVRVDAWAVPASANWSRTSKTIRKVSRVSRSTNWALPF